MKIKFLLIIYDFFDVYAIVLLRHIQYKYNNIPKLPKMVYCFCEKKKKQSLSRQEMKIRNK
jgi:hypothetical protein